MNTDRSYTLPPGWSIQPIASVCVINPKKPATDALKPTDPVTFVPMPAVDANAGAITAPLPRAFAEVRKGFTAFANKDVIVAKITPCFENGKAALCRGLTNGLGFGSTEFHVLRSTGVVLPEYVYHFVRQESFRRDGEANMTGSVGQKRVPAEWLKSVEIPFPPLAEQRRIVAKVEAMLARVNAARQRLAKAPSLLKRFRQSVLAAACSGGLTTDWRDDNPQIEMNSARLRDEQSCVWPDAKRTLKRLAKGHDDGDSDPTPPTWARVCLAECIREAPCNGISPPGREMPPGIAALKLNAMTANGFDFRAIKYIQIKDEVAADLQIQASDFFVSRGNGSASLVGRGTLAQEPPHLVVFPDTMIRLRFLKSVQATNWIPTIWDSRTVRLQIEAKAKTSAGIWKISQPDLCSIVVPLPPKSEQQEIVRRVDALFALADKIEARITAARTRADKLIQSTLAKAFRGDLVPTEHALAESEGREYESAEQLLTLLRNGNDAIDVPVRKRQLKKRITVTGAR